jgi:hypothetical protein
MATNREQKQNNGNNRNKSSKESNNNERNKNDREKKCCAIVVIKIQSCGICVSKLESTTAAALYSHLDRYIFISIQTNVTQIYVPYLEHSFAQKVV